MRDIKKLSSLALILLNHETNTSSTVYYQTTCYIRKIRFCIYNILLGFPCQLYFNKAEKNLGFPLITRENVILIITTVLKTSTWKIVNIIFTLWKDHVWAFILLSNVKMNITELYISVNALGFRFEWSHICHLIQFPPSF